MSIGITGFGAYLPRLRMNRQVIAEQNAWFAPQLKGKGRGYRTLANWDEDAITLAVAAARNIIAPAANEAARDRVSRVFLASDSLPFAERLNAGVMSAALRLEESIQANDMTGSQCAGLAAFSQACTAARCGETALLAAASQRRSRAASAQELDYGDGAAALTVGNDNVLAEVLGEASVTVDFVDHFRLAGEDIDYAWEERWVRDEGLSKLVPRAITSALKKSGVAVEEIDYFIFPGSLRKADAQLARQCGVPTEAVVDNLMDQVGDTGVAHGLLMLNRVLESAQPGQTILLSQFGSGAIAFVLRVTDAIRSFAPARSLAQQLEEGQEERNYTRFIAYKGQLKLERGMRGEQDKKTALSTSYRHRHALLGFVAGRCRETGVVQFPPSRITYAPGQPLQDTQEPYPLADRKGRVLSWSAESLSSYMAPPHHYGQVDFEGGGRVLMEFTDVRRGDIATGTEVGMVFRIKDIDDLRAYKRYFWKAVPLTYPAADESE